MVAERLPAVPKFSVTRAKIEVVLPEKRRDDHVYPLTNLDQNVCMTVKTVHLYRPNHNVKADPAKVIRDAFVKMLDHYYPLVGRLGISVDGKLQVNCSHQGALFIEAFTDTNIEDLGEISKPDDRVGQLVYMPPEAANIFEAPLLTAQVTKFKCGGFVFGLANQHSMFDGLGAVDFLRSWSEIARGLPLSIPPVLDRSMLNHRCPLQIEYPHDEFTEIENLSRNGHLTTDDVVPESFCFTPADTEALKKKVIVEGNLKSCTTFEVLSALIWKTRTMAMKMEPEQKTRLYFAVDGRTKFSPPIPKGFFGNGIVATFAMTTSSDLCGKPLYHAVELVQKAITLVNDRYMRSAIDFFENTHARPDFVGSVIITAWYKLPFQTTNFGWGDPWQSGPVVLPNKEIVLFLAHGKDRKNINVLISLPPKLMGEFAKLLKQA